MATLQSWRKAYGAIKDHTKVGLAHVNSDFKDVDVAIVKATNHVESPPKERHLRKIFMATSAVRPRADVAYCIHALSRRLTKTRNWTVALKTLIVIHRALREGDHSFREELLNFQQRGHVLQMSNFKDDSSPVAWDCSTWVRTYGVFLEERLECFKTLKYDIEAERLTRPGSQGQEKGYSRTRELDSEKLLEQLPALQQLLYRLIGCRPEGAAVNNYLIQYALALVLKESFKVYCAINDGIINLVDKFFEMPKHEAMTALDIYKRAGQQAGTLSDFYEVCKGLELARNFQFPVLREPPQSFLATMEEYIREAPRMVSAPKETLDYPERLMLTYKPNDEAPPSQEEPTVNSDERQLPTSDEVLISNVEAPPQPPTFPPQNHVDNHTADLLDLSNSLSDVTAIEEINALALAVVPTSSSTSSTYDPLATQSKDIDPTGWELALVTTPSSNISSVNERQLAGGLDTLTLSSLYDDAAYRGSQQHAMYGVPTAPNPFEATEPFAFSNNNIPPPPAVQMANNNPFGFYQQPAYPPQQQQPQQHQQMVIEPSNPFGDDAGFGAFPTNQVGHQQHASNNPFGSTGLI